ncbi:MAG: secretin N-terminal domain-containing protein [Candidatus Xenobiia bacterium LiM19]
MHMTVIAVLCISSACIARSEEQPAEQQPAERITHKVYRLSYQKAADVEKLIRIFLSREGQVVSDERSNTLIVKDYPSILKVVSDFIREHDVAQPQVRVYVKFQSQESSSFQNWGVSGFQVQNGWRVAVWAAGSAQSSSARASMNLITISGTWGEISCGENIPYPEWFFTWAQNYGYISAIPAYRQVSTGFAVMPVVKGDSIEVTVAPQISYFTDRERGIIRFEKAACTVRMQNGQSIVLAAGDGEQSTIIRRLLGSASFSQSQSVIMMLTPVIDRR